MGEETTMWHSDFDNGKAYRLDGDGTWVEAFEHPPLPSGLAWEDRTKLWSV